MILKLVRKMFFPIWMSGALICFAAAATESPASAPASSHGSAPKQARVLFVEDSAATREFKPQPEIVRAMVNRGILQFTGKTNLALAWRTVVSTQDVVGLKVFSTPGADSGTRPSVVAAVIEGLLAAGLPPKKIIIWDKQMNHLRDAGFVDLAKRYKVRVAASASAGYDEKVFYESSIIGNLVWGDLEFGKDKGKNKDPKLGRKSFVTKVVTREITRIISLAPLLNHYESGVSGHLCSVALGSVENTVRFEARADRLATAVPDIFNLPELGDRVVLNITDALIGQYQGEQSSLFQYATAVNQLWFSKDPVALDVVAVHELERERVAAKIASDKINLELYENASLIELGVSDLKKIKIEVTK